jgi:hypothetical protein
MARADVAYLAYGSNLHPQRLAARIGVPLAAHTVRLEGWALRFHKRSQDGSGKCDIVPAPGMWLFGVVYTLTRQAKTRLDDIEGAGFGYAVTELNVSGSGRVSTYRAQAHAIDGQLRPYDWYLHLVIAGARHHGFPEDYLAQLRSVATREDPDPLRRARMAGLLSPP